MLIGCAGVPARPFGVAASSGEAAMGDNNLRKLGWAAPGVGVTSASPARSKASTIQSACMSITFSAAGRRLTIWR